jgi:TDG/mug DNA glycosylase family protein
MRRILAFNGKRSATVVLDRSVGYGRQPEELAYAAVWILPSTSAAARGYWDISVWQQLAVDARA